MKVCSSLSMASHLFRIKPNFFTVAYKLHVIWPTLLKVLTLLFTTLPVHSILNNWFLCCLCNVPKYTLVLGPLYLCFPVPRILFLPKFTRPAHSLPSDPCSKTTLSDFQPPYKKQHHYSHPLVILYLLCLYNHLTYCMLKKKLFPSRDCKTPRSTAVFPVLMTVPIA